MNTANPVTPMQEAMSQMRELFVSAVDAGFTETQACMMLGAFMAASQTAGGDQS